MAQELRAGREAEILEGGQKGGVFHKAVGAPASGARREVSQEHPRVWGAGLLAEKRKPKAASLKQGLGTRGLQ